MTETDAIAALPKRLELHRFPMAGQRAKWAHPPTLEMVPAGSTAAFSGLRRNLLAGIAMVVIFGGVIGTLVAKTVIAGAVIASGVVVVQSGAKAVQHPSGGIVKALFVSEDEFVRAGQPLVELDTTLAQAQLASAELGLMQQQARLARLLAERDGLKTIDFSDLGPSFDPRIAAVAESEGRQFALRLEDRDGKRAQLKERIQQSAEEVKGYQAQLKAAQSQIEIGEDEVARLRSLFKKKLVPQARLNEVERELSQQKGSAGSFQSAIASSRGRMAELELSIIQVDQTMRSEITDQLASAQEAIGILIERQIVAKTALAQGIVYAPKDGLVHELSIHTVGGVVKPAEVMMLVVPEADMLVGDVRLRPNDIDQLYPGQQARITFSAFDRGTTPSINGVLKSISPDLEQDPRTGAMFYHGTLTFSEGELKQVRGLHLSPGMPLEVFVQTGERTLVSYFLKPITDQLNRAFR